MQNKNTKHRLTIKDIARLSGVGKSTVSRVLNHESSVSPQTREKVEAIIAEYDFSPSKSARAMRGHSDKVIGIIVSRLDSNAENQAVQSMLPLFHQHGYDPILIESQFDSGIVAESLKMLAHRNVDGVILFAFTGLDSSILEKWRDRLVVIARDLPHFSSVNYDDRGAIEQLMTHLLTQRHQHIGFIGVNHDDATTGLMRWQAYCDFCQHHQLQPYVQLGELSYQSGYQLTPKVLTDRITALVCATDTIALGVSKYLQDIARTNVQVCGIGNNSLLHFMFPSTFSVDPGYGEAGRLAAKQLLAQLNHGAGVTALLAPSHLVFHPTAV